MKHTLSMLFEVGSWLKEPSMVCPHWAWLLIQSSGSKLALSLFRELEPFFSCGVEEDACW